MLFKKKCFAGERGSWNDFSRGWLLCGERYGALPVGRLCSESLAGNWGWRK